MKVGIVTFQRVNNYGTVLQMYALYKTVQDMDITCDVIDYQRNNIKDVIVWQKNKIRHILTGHPDKQLYGNWEFVKIMILEVFLNSFAKKEFNGFRELISFSRNVDKKTIKELNSEYDVFISGSDQVWNCGRINLDATYMLDFVTNAQKKISYAASFGFKEIPDKYRERYKKILQDYRKVSIRETDGIRIYNDLTGRNDAVRALDPSMLLDIEEWEAVAREEPESEPYVLVYQLGSSKNLLKFASELAENHNCKLLALPHAFGVNIKAKWCLGKGPREWLGLFLKAKYIVTNSFHGTAFSINFNKDFFVEVSEKRSRVAIQSRVYNLLDIFHLESRIIKGGYNKIVDVQIDYSAVNEQLASLREDSKKYLENALR